MFLPGRTRCLSCTPWYLLLVIAIWHLCHYNNFHVVSVEELLPASLTFQHNLPPRHGDIPILNTYWVDHPSACSTAITSLSSRGGCIDFIVSLYYIDSHHGHAHVRRLDQLQWDWDLTITITLAPASSNSKHATNNSLVEIIHLGNSTASFKQLDFNTHSIALIADDSIRWPYHIPKTIVQTYYTYNATSVYHWNAYHSFADLNPEYRIMMMLDIECRQFIKQYFHRDVLEAYDLLIPKAFRADLFRYCYIYIMGGCYFDNKMINRIPLRRLWGVQDDLVVCSDALPGGVMAETLQSTTKLYNAIICARALDYRMKRVVEYVVERIHNRKTVIYEDLGLTGPIAFLRAIRDNIDEDNLRLKHGLSKREGYRSYVDYFVLHKTYRGGREIAFTKFFQGYYDGHGAGRPRQDYSAYWRAGQVFYDGPIVWKHLKLYAACRTTRDFTLHFLSNGTLMIERRALTDSVDMANIGGKQRRHQRRLQLEDGPNAGHSHHLVSLKVTNDITSLEVFTSVQVPLNGPRFSSYYLFDKYPALMATS